MKIKITRISKSSWFKIQAENIIIHFDPGYMGYYLNQNIPEEELSQKADYIFVSHDHKDHFQSEAYKKIVTEKTKLYSPVQLEGVKKYIKTQQNTIINEGKIEIQITNAYNTLEGHSTKKYHQIGNCVGYIIKINDVFIYHSGDTDVIPEMSNLGKIDIAFLPISGIYVMDLDEAIKATEIINPRYVVPMHELESDPDTFIAKINLLDKSKQLLIKTGESAEIDI